MKIAFDMDDVLAAFQVQWLSYHNRVYKTSIKYDDTITYDYSELFRVPMDTILSRVHDFYNSLEFKEIKPCDGAQHAIEMLSDHELFVVTSRKEEIRPQTLAWLEQYFPSKFSAVYLTNQFTDNKSAVVRTKGEVCIELGIDIAIDDAAHQARELSSKNIRVLMPHRPWNSREDTSSPLIKRVVGWEEVVKEISNLQFFNSQ